MGYIWIHIFILIFQFYKIIQYFKRRIREIINKNKDDEIKFLNKKKIIFFSIPIILIISKLPCSINRLFMIIEDKNTSFLYILQAIASPLMAVFNSFIFISIHKCFLKNKSKL